MAALDTAAIKTRLRDSRTKAGITQARMADILQVHPRSVQDYESLKNETVPWDRLDEWAAATGVTKIWLLQDDDPTTPEARLDQFEQKLDRAIELLEQVLSRLLPPPEEP